MNSEALLALIGDLYAQIVELQQKVSEADARVALITERLRRADSVTDDEDDQ